MQELFLTSSEKSNELYYPKWLHVMLPRGKNTPEVRGDEWLGVLSSIKSYVSTTVASQLDESERAMSKQIMAVQAAQAAKMDEILKLLQQQQQQQQQPLAN